MNMNRKTITTVAIVIVILAGILLAYTVISRIGKQAVDLTVLPTTATVTVDGRSVNPHSTLYLAPGKHTVLARDDNFASEERVITIPTDYVDMSLDPINETGREWVAKNQRLYRPLQERAEQRTTAAGLALSRAYTISDKLPYSEPDNFTIGYRTSDGTEKSFVITIRANSSLGRSTAIAQIGRWGYNPADYTIDFVGYNNPLKVEGANP